MGYIRSMNKYLPSLLYPVFLLIFLELFSRVFLSTKFTMNFIDKINCDTSFRLQYVGDRNRSHPGYEEIDIYDPTKGWSLKQNLNMSASNGLFLSSNSKGIRGKKEYGYGKSSKKRILILGDSFTFGEGVSDNETYPYYLQLALPFIEIINFGVHGYGHDQMLIYFREEGIKYKPDILILGFVGDDMNRNILEFRDYPKPKFEILNGKLKLKNPHITEAKEFIKKEPFRSRFVDLLSLIYQSYMQKMGLNYKKAEGVTTAILDEIVDVAHQINAIPVFVYLPVGNEMSVFNNKLRQEEYLSRYCMDRGVYYLSLKPGFLAKANSGIALKTEGHWGAKENQIAAQVIRGYLENKNIIAKNR